MNFFAERFGSNGFLGEQLWLGHTGHFFIVLSFVASAVATFAYFAAEFSKKDTDNEHSWKKLARAAFIAQGFSILSIFVLLFVMILNHMFEYHYAWRHSSKSLPIYYIISSFWEGQEGSFLLWQFWLAVQGIVGIKILKDYENPVMGIVSLTQFFLGSMVLGVYIFGFKFGSNPFLLLRDVMANAPIFQRPNYLDFIEDGNGLNPLLQNYWMTIHPPVLFCGFASTVFPFAFAISSLIRKDWNGWVKPALPWVLFCLAILGTGILMGGAWAYESLSFGGFWAWDPVENMSLVPWLMVLAGLHTMLIYRYTKHSLISSYVFLILGFVLVLYSTYLTRSGRLGDTSVHSFTDDGLEPQLLAYLFFFLITGFTLLIIRVIKKQIPTNEKEEDLWSREFWMFIGTLVLFLSAIQMIFTTSIPVWNLIFHDNLHWLKNKIAPPVEVISHYNRIQVWLGILIASLTAMIQYLSYKSGKIPSSAKWAAYTFALSFVVASGICYSMNIEFTAQHLIDLTGVSDKLFFKFPFISTMFLLTLASVYAAFANLAYFAFILQGKIKLSGGSVAHFGFGLFMIGVVLSQGKKEVISMNKSGIDFGKDFKMNEKLENILLLKDSTLTMADYSVTYRGTNVEPPNNVYSVEYIRKDIQGNETENFVLKPNAQLNPKMGLIANPDTKHYLTKDVFTHVSSVPDNSKLKDSISFITLAVGDSFFTRNSFVVFRNITPNPTLPDNYDTNRKIFAGIQLEALNSSGSSYPVQPVFVIDLNDNSTNSIPAKIEELGLQFDVQKIDPNSKKVTITVREKEKASDFIIMKAIVFPYINLVWIGGIITFLGTLISMYRRRKENA
jgi:cytochrome c-type biogenesis protein CcmF